MLEDNGTRVLKFYLNVSKEAQKERLMERIEDAGEALEAQGRRLGHQGQVR